MKTLRTPVLALLAFATLGLGACASNEENAEAPPAEAAPMDSGTAPPPPDPAATAPTEAPPPSPPAGTP